MRERVQSGEAIKQSLSRFSYPTDIKAPMSLVKVIQSFYIKLSEDFLPPDLNFQKATMRAEIKSQLIFRPEIFELVKSDIQAAYLEDNRPWVVGFSGGKDSTLLMELVYYSLASIPPDLRTKQIYVLASDTRVETPDIPTDLISHIWKHVYKEEPMPELESKSEYLSKEDQILQEVCEDMGFPFETMRRLHEIEIEHGHLKRRHGLPGEMREVFRADI